MVVEQPKRRYSDRDKKTHVYVIDSCGTSSSSILNMSKLRITLAAFTFRSVFVEKTVIYTAANCNLILFQNLSDHRRLGPCMKNQIHDVQDDHVTSKVQLSNRTLQPNDENRRFDDIANLSGIIKDEDSPNMYAMVSKCMMFSAIISKYSM